MLASFTQIDYDREMAFIATTDGSGREVELAHFLGFEVDPSTEEPILKKLTKTL